MQPQYPVRQFPCEDEYPQRECEEPDVLVELFVFSIVFHFSCVPALKHFRDVQ